MKRIIRWVLSRPISSIVFFAALIAGGTLALIRTPVDFLPQIDVPQITIVTEFPGLPASDLRELVTIPLEDALSGLNGLRKLRSYSRDGSSLIQITLDWGTNMEIAALRAREIIDIAYLSLPSQAKKPLVLPVNPGEEPILLLGVFPKEKTLSSLVLDITEREISSALQQVEGVGSIQVYGGQQELIEVSVDQSRLSRTGVGLSALSESIGATNAEYPSGSLDEGETRYIIKTDGRRSDWKDIGNIPIGGGNESKPIHTKDVADIQRIFDDRYAFLVTGNNEGIAVAIRRNSGFSPTSLSKNVQKKIPILNNAYHSDLEIRILEDRSEEIQLTLSRLVQSGLIGALAAFVVLWFSLKHIGYAAIVLSSIPLSILGAVIGMRALNLSFNIMSLGGLTLGIGMLVDNSVVVLENLVRKANPKDKNSIAEVSSEITNSTVGSTLTSVLVFLPLFLLPGLLGELFSDMAWAIVFSLTFSLIVSATWIPLMFALFSTADNEDSLQSYQPIRRFIRTSLRKPGHIAAIASVLLISSLILGGTLSFRWLQKTVQTRIETLVDYPAGTTVEHLFDTAVELVPFLESQSGIIAVTATGGGNPADPYFLANPEKRREQLNLSVQIAPKTLWTPELIGLLVKGRITGRRDIHVVSSYPPDLLSQVMNINDGRATLLVASNEPDLAITTAHTLASRMGGDVRLVPHRQRPQLQIVPDRQAVARYGMSLSPIASHVATAVNGQVVSSYEESGRRIPIRVRLSKKDRNNRESLMSLNILSTNSGPVSLKDLTHLRQESDYPILYREGRQDVAYLNVPDNEVNKWLDIGDGQIKYPESEEKASQGRDLLLIFMLALGLLYILLGIQFDSFGLPILFLATLPFALSGSLLLIWLVVGSLNLNSILGMLVVLGLSINNAILLFENYRRKMRDTLSRGLVVYIGTVERIRPILITSSTTVIALLPLALDLSGRNPQSSLALAVVGGLILSVFVAFGLFPSLFKAALPKETSL